MHVELAELPVRPDSLGWIAAADFLTDGTSVWVIDFWETNNEGAPEIVAFALPELLPDIKRAAVNLL